MDFKQTPNKWNDRKGEKIRAIVVHICEGQFKGCLSTCVSPASQVSYHYIIDKSGAITQLADLAQATWHAGKVVKPTWSKLRADTNPNLYTVGISLGNTSAETPTMPQVEALCALIAHISKTVRIRISADTIVFHREIRGDKTCPGAHVHKQVIINTAQAFRRSGAYRHILSLY